MGNWGLGGETVKREGIGNVKQKRLQLFKH